MRDDLYDEPERLAGVIFHIAAILFLLGASGWGIWQAAHSEIGPVFVLYLLPALASIGLVPTLIYRLYSLLGAFYQVERDGMRLRWGLRIEDIPMDTILWVSLIADLERKPPMPWIRWPGAVLGTRRLPNGTPLEYLASNSRDLILVATQRHAYAISPQQPKAFLEKFERFMELGSIFPVQARSVYPSFLLARIWRLRSARALLLSGFLLNILLLLWVSFIVPNRPNIVLGFMPGSGPVPAVQLVLLPVLSAVFFLFDSFLGFFFYRGEVNPPPIEADASYEIDFSIEPSRSKANANSRLNQLFKGINEMFSSLRQEVTLVPGQFLAHLLWGSGAVTPILFMLAVFFMLRTPG